MRTNGNYSKGLTYGLVALAVAALLSAPAVAQNTVPVLGGNTQVALDSVFVETLVGAGILPSAIPPGMLDLDTRDDRLPDPRRHG